MFACGPDTPRLKRAEGRPIHSTALPAFRDKSTRPSVERTGFLASQFPIQHHLPGLDVRDAIEQSLSRLKLRA
jgi:hypothetical protein